MNFLTNIFLERAPSGFLWIIGAVYTANIIAKSIERYFRIRFEKLHKNADFLKTALDDE